MQCASRLLCVVCDHGGTRRLLVEDKVKDTYTEGALVLGTRKIGTVSSSGDVNDSNKNNEALSSNVRERRVSCLPRSPS